MPVSCALLPPLSVALHYCLSLSRLDRSFSVQKVQNKIISVLFTSFVRFAHFSINLLSSRVVSPGACSRFVHSHTVHTHMRNGFSEKCVFVDQTLTLSSFIVNTFFRSNFSCSLSDFCILTIHLYIYYIICWQIFVPCYLFFLFVFFFIHYCVYDSQLPKLLTMSTTHLILRGGEFYQHTKYLSISVSIYISISSYTYCHLHI